MHQEKKKNLCISRVQYYWKCIGYKPYLCEEKEIKTIDISPTYSKFL